MIGQLKVLNSLLKPYEELTAAAGDLTAMAELAAEDASWGQMGLALRKAGSTNRLNYAR